MMERQVVTLNFLWNSMNYMEVSWQVQWNSVSLHICSVRATTFTSTFDLWWIYLFQLRTFYEIKFLYKKNKFSLFSSSKFRWPHSFINYDKHLFSSTPQSQFVPIPFKKHSCCNNNFSMSGILWKSQRNALKFTTNKCNIEPLLQYSLGHLPTFCFAKNFLFLSVHHLSSCICSHTKYWVKLNLSLNLAINKMGSNIFRDSFWLGHVKIEHYILCIAPNIHSTYCIYVIYLCIIRYLRDLSVCWIILCYMCPEAHKKPYLKSKSTLLNCHIDRNCYIIIFVECRRYQIFWILIQQSYWDFERNKKSWTSKTYFWYLCVINSNLKRDL